MSIGKNQHEFGLLAASSFNFLNKVLSFFMFVVLNAKVFLACRILQLVIYECSCD